MTTTDKATMACIKGANCHCDAGRRERCGNWRKVRAETTMAENEAMADHIMKIDGDRDHMNQSRLTCEMTQAVARHLRAMSRPAPERTVDTTKLNAGQLVQRIMRSMDSTSPPGSTAELAEQIAAGILDLPPDYWSRPAPTPADGEVVSEREGGWRDGRELLQETIDAHLKYTAELEARLAAPAAEVTGLETIQTLLDLLNPLHGSLDKQTYDDKARAGFDAPSDAEYAVNVTAQQERDLTQAVMILEDRKRQATTVAAAEVTGERRKIIYEAVWQVCGEWRPGMTDEVKDAIGKRVVERIAKISDEHQALTTPCPDAGRVPEGANKTYLSTREEKIAAWAERYPSDRPLPFSRDELGRIVRAAWVRWANTQPNPKAHWLVTFDHLDEPDKEADRQIGEIVARAVIDALASPAHDEVKS